MSFILGQKVQWTSQAQGCEKKKEGVVVYAWKGVKQQTPVKVAEDLFSDCSRMFDGYKFKEGEVLVKVATGKNGKGKPKLYKPKLKGLRSVD